MLNDHFIYYESDEGMVGFYIVDQTEAAKFLQIISSRLPSRPKSRKKPQKRPSRVGFPKFTKSSRINKQPRREKKRSSGNVKPSRLKSRNTRVVLYSVNDLTPEWKKFLKDCGITKRDFKRPDVQSHIKAILKEHNISLIPPPAMTMSQAKKIYTQPNHFEQYKKYSMAQSQYERELRRYEQELKEYNQQLTTATPNTLPINQVPSQQTGYNSRLQKPTLPPRIERPQFPALPPVEEDDLERAVDDFFNDELFQSKKSLKMVRTNTMTHQVSGKIDVRSRKKSSFRAELPPRRKLSSKKVERVPRRKESGRMEISMKSENTSSTGERQRTPKSVKFATTIFPMKKNSIAVASTTKDSASRIPTPYRLHKSVKVPVPPPPPPVQELVRLSRTPTKTEQLDELEAIADDDYKMPLAKIKSKQPSLADMLASKKTELRSINHPTLPDLSTLSNEEKMPLLEMVRRELLVRRTEIHDGADDDDDSESDWSID